MYMLECAFNKNNFLYTYTDIISSKTLRMIRIGPGYLHTGKTYSLITITR